MASALYACAVCFGGTDNAGLASGLTWGLFVLLAFTFAILGALGLTVYRIERQRARAEKPGLSKDDWTDA